LSFFLRDCIVADKVDHLLATFRDLDKLGTQAVTSLYVLFNRGIVGRSFFDRTFDGFGVSKALEQMTHHDLLKFVCFDHPFEAEWLFGMTIVAMPIVKLARQAFAATTAKHHATEQVFVL
jgi:hypothetical protein